MESGGVGGRMWPFMDQRGVGGSSGGMCVMACVSTSTICLPQTQRQRHAHPQTVFGHVSNLSTSSMELYSSWLNCVEFPFVFAEAPWHNFPPAKSLCVSLKRQLTPKSIQHFIAFFHAIWWMSFWYWLLIFGATFSKLIKTKSRFALCSNKIHLKAQTQFLFLQIMARYSTDLLVSDIFLNSNTILQLWSKNMHLLLNWRNCSLVTMRMKMILDSFCLHFCQ